MNAMDDVVFWIVGLFVAGVVAHLALNALSDEARGRRKRRRNYGRVVARARRPMVRLSVHTK